MKTPNLAKLVLLSLLVVATMSDAHAAYLTQAETRNETIFVPSCWPDEFRPQWLNCVVAPRPGPIRALRDRR
jgi:hypothetical protein